MAKDKIKVKVNEAADSDQAAVCPRGPRRCQVRPRRMWEQSQLKVKIVSSVGEQSSLPLHVLIMQLTFICVGASPAVTWAGPGRADGRRVNEDRVTTVTDVTAAGGERYCRISTRWYKTLNTWI